MKTWTLVKATLPVAPEDWAVLDEVFDRHGVGGTVQTDTPPSMSGYAYEPTPEALNALVEELKEHGAEVEVSEVPEENWAESWKQFFVPRRIGRRFVIRPTWEEFESGPDDLVIVLDPGQAFGTGDHPTTRMCLQHLEDMDLSGKTIADIGCGSGVLSIGAHLLGCGPIVGVDVEKESVETSIENATLNSTPGEFFVGMGFDPLPADATYDIVLSNIISAALIALAPEVGTRVKQGGYWVVSGVIEANWPDVKAAAERAGFTFESMLQENEWVAAKFSL